MLSEIVLPIWAQTCCTKQSAGQITPVTVKERLDGTVEVVDCISTDECFGCDPVGVVLPFDPLRLELVEQFSASYFSEEECLTMVNMENEFCMSDLFISERLRKYSDASEQYYFVRCYWCDSDTIRVFKLKAKLKQEP